MNSRSMISDDNVVYNYRSHYLPHKFAPDSFIFITYRLAFSLPQSLINSYREKKLQLHQAKNSPSDDDAEASIDHDLALFEWFDGMLARSHDLPDLCKDIRFIEIIGNSFKHFDKEHYHLIAYCIMPNHVHVLIYPLMQKSGHIYSVTKTVYGWKRFTANQINRLLGHTGSLWHREWFDHLVRNEEGAHRVIKYIIDNPVKAGLVKDWRDWPGTYRNMGLFGLSEPS